MKRVSLVLTLAVAAGLSAQAASAQTLKTVKDRGMLSCGVSQGLPGFSSPDDKGNWTGLDVDVCRAVAAAVFNDATKVKFVPLSAKDRFTALQSGEIDVLSRNTTWTLSRDTSLGANFTGVTYYDGQGFLVKKSLKVNSALELNSASVCVQTGTTTEQNLADYFKGNNMKYEVIAFASADETVKAYESGRCDVFTSDVSQLYAERLKLANPADHVVLPEVISKEPLGPMVRHGDDQWFDIVKWTLFAMLDAEELGVTQKNVDEMAKSDKPELKRAFGTDGNLGEQLGLTKDWVSRIVKAVGNYGEAFDRNVGAGSKLGIARGLNNLWNKGVRAADPLIAGRGLRRWPSNLENHRRSYCRGCSGRLAAGQAGAASSSRSCLSPCSPGSPTKSSPMPAPICRRSGSPRALASWPIRRASMSASI
jgi:general L-amino acid transport system substrate-binding protein